MNRFKTKIVGLATAVLLSAGALIAPLTASAVTVDELMAQIVALQAQLQTLQGSSASTADKCSFTRSLTVGSKGDDVTCLQNYLKGAGHLSASATGYFGSLTKAAAAKWQAANGVTPATGYFGSISRAKYTSLMAMTSAGSSSSTSSTATTSSAGSSSSVTATGSGLTITAATQPAATLAVKSAARLPFTKVTLTAGTQDVVVTGITVERTGLANDAAFAGVVLMDDAGAQLGIAKTFNSDHKATVGDTLTIKAGTSKTFTVAGNMASDETAYAGQVAYLSVTGVTTSATVSGSLPISGAGHTINNSLTVGSIATIATGSLDPVAGDVLQTKNIGSTGYTFSSIKLTTGSAEKVRIKSIRWNQSGSVGSGDLANLKTYVDGVAYDTTVSSDGKYFTSTFGTGIVVDKGGNTEISIKGDITGGSGRTIDFDIYKTTDVYVTGETYGYGITPPAGSTSASNNSDFHAGTPWFDGGRITVSSGSITVTRNTAVASQNIVKNISGQPLGGFTMEVKGEPISANNLIFKYFITGSGGVGTDITSISLYDENGNVVAGPAEGSGSTVAGSVTFSDTVTFPIGIKSYTLKGKIGTAFTNGQTIVASTTPSSNWSSITGQTTGNTISGTSVTSSVVTGSTMTVKAAALTISVSTSPVAQTVVSGSQAFTFANYLLDASNSGEDIRMNSIPLEFSGFANQTNVTNCALYDGSTQLTTGSNVKNPTAAASSSSFTFDSALTITKGTVKNIALKCNLASGGTGSYRWGYDSSSSPTATGVTSGQSMTDSAGITENDGTGQLMSLTDKGSLTVAADSSAPSYGLVASNSTVTIGVFKFSAANEAIKLTKLGLKITNTASTTVSDLTQITLWDGSTQVGSLVFTGTTGTSTLTSDFIVPKDGDKLLTMKADLAKIGASESGSNGAVIAIDMVAGNAQGTGASSGTTIDSTSGATAFSGARMFRSYPVFAKLSVPSTTLVTGTMDLYRFSVTANPSTGNGIGLHTLNLNIATSSGSNVSGTTTVTSADIYAYTDSSFSNPVSGFTSGKITTSADLTALKNSGDNIAALSSILQIPAGSTYYFRVVATVTLTAGSGTFSGSVSTKVSGDTSYSALANLMGIPADVTTGGGKLIWSPNATTTSSATHRDWTNGYGVSGLTNIDTVTISK